jgi:ferritin-like metal-binding protein YciE
VRRIYERWRPLVEQKNSMAEDIKALVGEKLNQTYTTEKLILESLPKMDQVAQLLQQTLQEEKATDEKLTMLAESEVNPTALQKPA